MQKFVKILFAAAIVGALIVFYSVHADEEKIALDKLPKAVVDAVKAKFPKAELISAEKEKDDGKTVYEVNIKDAGVNIEVTATPDGKIVTIEKEIAATELPKNVADALKAKYPTASIKKAEEVSKEDKVTAYEVLILNAGDTLEVKFDPAGKVIEVENQSAEKKSKK